MPRPGCCQCLVSTSLQGVKEPKCHGAGGGQRMPRELPSQPAPETPEPPSLRVLLQAAGCCFQMKSRVRQLAAKIPFNFKTLDYDCKVTFLQSWSFLSWGQWAWENSLAQNSPFSSPHPGSQALAAGCERKKHTRLWPWSGQLAPTGLERSGPRPVSPAVRCPEAEAQLQVSHPVLLGEANSGQQCLCTLYACAAEQLLNLFKAQFPPVKEGKRCAFLAGMSAKGEWEWVQLPAQPLVHRKGASNHYHSAVGLVEQRTRRPWKCTAQGPT